MLKSRIMAFVLAALCGSAAHAGPIVDAPPLDIPIFGGSLLVATDGHVEAEFLGSMAGYFNILYLDTRSDWGSRLVFHKYTEMNTRADLGYFSAGTELIFRLKVLGRTLMYFSGEASRNPDQLAHAMAVTTRSPDGTYLTRVGFEDLLGGGDLDYNDFNFSLTNVVDPPSARVSEPAILLLLISGLAGLVVTRRRAVVTGIAANTSVS